jgi:hypothetical protein
MNAADCFSPSYVEARAKFLAAASAKGAVVHSYRNQHIDGPDGQPLFTDIARIGDECADALLIIGSGTHGVEGYCGSACQVALFGSCALERRPARAAILLIHALNPYGFAYDRRVNEDNVDLNRNFVDHSRPPKDDEDYRALHDALVPESWEGRAKDEADAVLARYRAERGEEAYQRAATRGQYGRADGLFYGGRKPTWSNDLLRRVIGEQCGFARRIIYIDVHTGLGPPGHGEAIYTGSDMRALERARRWYGDVRSTVEGNSASAPIRGDVACAFATLGPGVEVTPIALEFGTVSLAEMLEAVRADNWLHVRGGDAHPQAGAIKRRIRAAFQLESRAWQEAVIDRFLMVGAAAITNLGEEEG